MDRFFIKEKLDDKIVELPKIRLEDQLVDILTKAAVSSRVFSMFLDKLGMCDIYTPTWGRVLRYYECLDIRNVEILGYYLFFTYIIPSLYHSFPFLEWWLPSIYTLYMNEWNN